MADTQNSWQKLQTIAKPTILDLFASDGERLEQFTLHCALPGGEIYFDWSKTHVSQEVLRAMLDLATTRQLAGWRDCLFAGDTVNHTEGRAAVHMAQRGVGNADDVAEARGYHARMHALIEAIDGGVLGEIHHILHIGIGGSALGPDLVMDALGRDAARYDVHVVSNVDGAALEEAFAACDPVHSLIAIASKTFTTTETLMNADSAIAWLQEAGVADPYGRVIALTAMPDSAREWGVDETRILPFSESVGGRYSIWSSIGFPVALALGWSAFEDLLRGAAAMDRHFIEADFNRNAPVLAAFVDLYYAQVQCAQTRAVFAYDERLRLLPSYLQQLEMESNGKSVHRDGSPLSGPSAPITWGGVGTDGQHAVFQLLHQGTHILPVEFLASKTPGHDLDMRHHAALLTNCFAQGAALMAGKASDDPARGYAGDRPSSTILLDEVNAATLGALIAFYEHRTFVNAVMLDINPFDQFGVELGKVMAKSIAANPDADFDPSTLALIEAAGL